LIALGLLVVIVVATYLAMYGTLEETAHARQRVAATELAEQWLDKIAQLPLSTLQGYIGHNVVLTPSPVTIVGTAFNASAHLEWSGEGSSPSLCLSGNPPQVITATVTVNWNVSISLAETTVINPPYGTAVPTDGWVSVQITGSSGSHAPMGVNAVVVGINDGPHGAITNYSPDDTGCVYQQEPPGTYTVTLSSPPGGPQFIDGQENPNPSTSATVVAGLASFTSFHYDEAATVNFAASSGSPAATGMPVAVGNGQLIPLPWRTIVPAGSSATSMALYPYPSGYQVWYGDCPAEQPTTPSEVATAPGATASAMVTGLADLPLQVTGPGSTPMPGATATATVQDAGNGCPADTFGLAAASMSAGQAISDTSVIPETYSVTVTDPGNHQHTTLTAVVSATGVTVGGTTYPTGTPVPVSAP
ncbi:MAG TPA: hypothetical protein VMU09_10110, partial [Acidimicrobiales bacterium]|nr:hypothetical protein [Acidimicrobiales bacterium]